MIQWKLKKEVGQIYYWEPSQTKDTSESSGFEKTFIKPPVDEKILINIATKVRLSLIIDQSRDTRPLNMFSGQKNSPDSISMDIALFLYMRDCVYN